MATKPITNQRTKKEIREEVAQIDKEVPETKEFVKIMTDEEGKKESEDSLEIEETPEEETPKETIIEEAPIEEEVPEEELEEPAPASQPVQIKNELPSADDRYREAGQEAMILNSKLKKVAETMEEAESIPEPTVDELKEYAKQMGEDYENLDVFAQNMLKENLQNKRRFGKVAGLFTEEKKIGEWVKKVEDFVDLESTTQTYPDLENNKDDFIKYCSKKSHIGADLELLIAGFMWKQPVKKSSQGSVLLPSGKGGAGQPKNIKPTELTEDDAKVYRQKDPKKYKQLIKQKKFK